MHRQEMSMADRLWRYTDALKRAHNYILRYFYLGCHRAGLPGTYTMIEPSLAYTQMSDLLYQ